jgi:hypothetical protein
MTLANIAKMLKMAYNPAVNWNDLPCPKNS